MRSGNFIVFMLLAGLLWGQTKSSTYNSNKEADPKARALLVQVKENLKLDKGVELSFDFTYTAAESKPMAQKGKVSIKNKSFRLELNDQEMTCDGKTLWTFIKKRNELQIQDATEILNDPLSPYKMLQIHDSPDFTYIMSGSVKVNGQDRDVVEFKPLDTKAEFFKIRAEIDRSKKQYRKISLFLKNGDQYVLTLMSQTAKALADRYFTADIKDYPGALLEDLR